MHESRKQHNWTAPFGNIPAEIVELSIFLAPLWDPEWGHCVYRQCICGAGS